MGLFDKRKRLSIKQEVVVFEADGYRDFFDSKEPMVSIFVSGRDSMAGRDSSASIRLTVSEAENAISLIKQAIKKAKKTKRRSARDDWED